MNKENYCKDVNISHKIKAYDYEEVLEQQLQAGKSIFVENGRAHFTDVLQKKMIRNSKSLSGLVIQKIENGPTRIKTGRLLTLNAENKQNKDVPCPFSSTA